MAKTKGTKGQAVINQTHKTKDWETRTSLKLGILRCSGRISSSCSTVGTHRVTQTFNSIDYLHNIYLHMCSRCELCVMVLNATFNNISVLLSFVPHHVHQLLWVVVQKACQEQYQFLDC
jgi:hypothetical protein